MDSTVHSVVGKLNLLDGDVRKELVKIAEDDISKRSEDFYKKYQKKGIDILDVELKLNRKYPHSEIAEDTFRNVQIKVNTTVKLDGSQNITDTLE
jgi:hypothetical protein